MTFTAADFREWINILYKHPEWREELRRMVLTEELLELPNVVREIAEAQRELAEAQRRTEQRVEELAEAQRRTEQRVEELAEAQRELAEAQRRTEQRVEELAEAQRRTEQRVEELAKAQVRLGSAVGELQRAFGATVEEEAASVIEVVLRRKGYRILQPAYSLALDGEIDVVLPLEDPSGKQVWAVVEAKARLSQSNVRRWSQRMRSADWHKRLNEVGVKGPYLVYAYCIRADLGAQETAEKEGLGLLKSDGETLAPRGLIQPTTG
ncbi:MAG: hypothetical protein AB1345_11230 [Chloroflexota bacterium]